MSHRRLTRRAAVLGLRGVSVVLLFVLALEGPDLLLLAVLDAGRWLPVGLATGILTLPLLRFAGTGFAPPWTLPAYAAGVSLARTGVYHLVCTVVAAWLWTAPTLATVAWVHRLRGGSPVDVGTIPPDPASAVAGLFLAGVLLFALVLVVFVRLTPFRTAIDLRTTPVADILRPALVGVGGTVLAGVFVTFLATVVSGTITLSA